MCILLSHATSLRREDSAAKPSLSDTAPAENVEETPNEVDTPVEGAAAAE